MRISDWSADVCSSELGFDSGLSCFTGCLACCVDTGMAYGCAPVLAAHVRSTVSPCLDVQCLLPPLTALRCGRVCRVSRLIVRLTRYVYEPRHAVTNRRDTSRLAAPPLILQPRSLFVHWFSPPSATPP